MIVHQRCAALVRGLENSSERALGSIDRTVGEARQVSQQAMIRAVQAVHAVFRTCSTSVQQTA
ncbi:hypothetical protein [Paraburkholderia aromaticivorans]|uniref:hypothetical protein n=1 Tax=Paraburkholderia aromaticivorans TaxID=2026199 RepID=UPI001455E937|nr:hypothetical protein [Paraburkholderia aromaticivorans]